MSSGIGGSISAATLDRLLRLQAFVVEQTELLRSVQGDTATAATDAAVVAVNGAIADIRGALTAHEADHGNPHAVSASQVGAYTTAQVDAAIAAVRAALKVGSVVQAWNPSLDALAALNTTAFGRALLTLADATAGLNALGAAPNSSPQLGGVPTAPTAAPGTNSSQLATTAFVSAALAALVNGSPAALDTLKELADALGDDPNFATTIAAQIGAKAAAARALTAGAGLAGGGDLTADRTFSLAGIGSKTLLANLSASTAIPVPVSLPAVMDSALGSARGSIAVRGASGWGPLALGTSGYVLQSNGTDLVFGAVSPGTGAVRWDLAQALANADQLQARKNIGVLCKDYAYVSGASNILDKSYCGRALLVGAGSTVTLPPAGTVAVGDTMFFESWANLGGLASTIQVADSGTGNIGYMGAYIASLQLRPGQNLLLVCDGYTWVVFGYDTPANDAPSANSAQAFTDAQKLQLLQNLGLVQPAGQCRLVYTNSTTLTLIPFGGNQIFVNGAFRTIPSAGVTISNAGLTANSLYYVYAYWAGSALALVVSAQSHAVNPTYGHQVASGAGNEGLTLVGMVYTNVGSPGTFADAPASRWVASYYNRAWRDLYIAPTQGSTASTTLVEVASANRVYFLCWGDEATFINLNGSQYQAGSGASTNTQLMVDGNVVGAPSAHFHATGAQNYSLSLTAQVTLTEGQHASGFKGNVSQYTGTWTVGMGGLVRI